MELMVLLSLQETYCLPVLVYSAPALTSVQQASGRTWSLLELSDTETI